MKIKTLCLFLALLFAITPLTVSADTEQAETAEEAPLTEAETAEAAEESVYTATGAGVVIAVIDEGFEVSTSYFKLSEDIPKKLTKNGIRDLLPELHGKGTYINPKIPYIYDYANDTDVMSSNGEHGTHVAGIIGANGSKYTGTAPHAQLLLMKVFGDNGRAEEEDLAHAIEDAVKLGADVINVSIGILAGYADGSPFGDDLKTAFKTAEEAGVTVICAQGNGGRTGLGSYYSGIYGISDPTADIPDSGTTAAPASLDSVTAVGATVSPKTVALSFTLLDKPEESKESEETDSEKADAEEEIKGTKIRCTDSSYTYVEPIGQNLADRFDGETLEYVRVGGMGKKEDFEALTVSLEGKLALIERGEIAFVEKLNNAAEYGAVGAIVFDNVETDVYSLMQLEGATIPGVFISKKDGILLDEAEYKFVHLAGGETSTFANPYAGSPASYTSWGVTPELTLKPDVSAVGDNFKSIIPGGEIAEISGTSQAAAYVSGCAALWCEYLNANGLVRGTDYDADYVRALMMNAAKVNTSADTGIEHSPRVQGAGEVSADDVGKTGIIITSESGRAKLELGDKLGESFSFGADLTNITDTAAEVKLSAVLLGEEVTAYKITEGTVVEAVTDDAEKSELLPYFMTGNMLGFDSAITANGININRNAADAEELTLTIAPGETVTVKFGVSIGEELYNEYSSRFGYGFFAEGYIYAETEDSVSGIPYIGYVGDWSSIPVFDGELYADDTFYRNTYLYTDVTFYNRRKLDIDLGQNIYDENSEISSDFLAFSPNGDKCAESVNMSLDMLRSVRNGGFRITAPDGKTVYESGDREFIRKNYVDSSGMLSYSDIVLWGGRDQKNANYVYPDGIYKVTFYATPSYEGAAEQTLTFDLVLDTKVPTIESFEFITEEDKTLLKLKVSDEFYLMGVSVYGMLHGDTTDLNTDEPIATAKEPGVSYELTFDVTNCNDKYIYIDALDYAYNLVTERIENVNYKAPEN